MRRDILRGDLVKAISITLLFLLFYVGFQSDSIYGGDAGDLVSAAIVGGVPHPPGYPLYTILARLVLLIPFSTAAWRVAFLSSVPSALTIGIVYLILRKLRFNTAISLIVTLTSGFSYLFWLYSSVPEVFSLHLFLSSSLIFCLLSFRLHQRPVYLYLAGICFGLGLAHHHTILFLFPGLALLIYPALRKQHEVAQKTSKIRIRNWLIALGCVFLGTLCYIYVPLAARSQPPINWENAVNSHSFFRLVSRAIYGTYKSGNGFGDSSLDRREQVHLFILTLRSDFTNLGIILGLLGVVQYLRVRRKIFMPFLLTFLLSGPFFLFYAGFPALLSFYEGISERFYLLPFLIFTFFIAGGIELIVSLLIYFYRGRVNIAALSTFLFALLPISLLIINLPGMNALKHDRTAERLAVDIFNSVEDNAIIFMVDDTSVFNSQYVYFSTPTYRDRHIKPVQLGSVGYPYYTQILKNTYPELELAAMPENVSIAEYMIDTLPKKFPIYSLVKFTVGDEYAWIPHGLLFKLVPTNVTLPPIDQYITLNRKLFASYQDPNSGALSTRKHLMLNDVKRVYANGKRQVGFYLVGEGQFLEAEPYLSWSYKNQPELVNNGLQYGINLMLLKRCQEALGVLGELEKSFSLEPNIYKLYSLIYTDCQSDPTKAAEYERIYQEKSKMNQTPLNKL